MWLLSEISIWNVRGGGSSNFTIGSSCKECSGNLIEICGYPDPPKNWHFDACVICWVFLDTKTSFGHYKECWNWKTWYFDACESFVEFLSSSDQTKMTATWKMWLLSEINIWNVRGWGGLKFTVARSLCEIIKLSNLFLCQWLSFLVQGRSDRQGSSLALVKIWLLSEINVWNVRGGRWWKLKDNIAIDAMFQ